MIVAKFNFARLQPRLELAGLELELELKLVLELELGLRLGLGPRIRQVCYYMLILL